MDEQTEEDLIIRIEVNDQVSEYSPGLWNHSELWPNWDG